MERKGKKPPINISELTKGKKPEAEKGSLSYINKRGKKGSGKIPHVDWTQVLLSCVISLLLVVIIISQVAPSKGSVNDLAIGMDELSSRVTSNSGKLDEGAKSIANALGKFVNVAEFGTAKTESEEELSKLSKRVDNLTKLVDHYRNLAVQLRLDLDETEIRSDIEDLEDVMGNLDAGITFLVSEIAKLEERVKKLE